MIEITHIPNAIVDLNYKVVKFILCGAFWEVVQKIKKKYHSHKRNDTLDILEINQIQLTFTDNIKKS